MKSSQSEEQSQEMVSPLRNIREHLNIPQINILSGFSSSENKQSLGFNFRDTNQDINKKLKDNEENKTNETVNEKKEGNVKICVNSEDPNLIISKTSPIISAINNNKAKVKLSAQNLEKLSSSEKFDLALIALNQPANQRNLVEQKLIEEAIDSFAYIEKMKKRKPTLAKQVARVVEHQMCKKGQAVFYAGQQPEKFYLILRGKVAVLLKKSESQIAMDRKNGKYINLQNILERNNANNSYLQSLDKTDSFDLNNSLLNTPKSPMRVHSPSNFASQKNNNSPLLHNYNNSQLLTNTNQNGFIGRKLSVQVTQNISQFQPTNKIRQMSIFNSNFLNDKGSDSSSSNDNFVGPQDFISQINRDNQGELNTPTLISGHQRLSQARHRNTISLSKNASIMKTDIRPIENISKNIDMTPNELEEPEKFYDNGVFRYEFAKELEQGAAFGEMGLLLKVPRTATILAVEDTDFVVMSKQNYQQIIKSLENYKLEKKIQFFHSVLHYDFKIDEFGKLCIDFSQKKEFIKDQHIFKEGDKSNEILVIKSGEVELYKTITGADGKKKKIQLSYIGPGEILGIEELFYQKEQRYYNAKCLHQVKAYYINKYLFIRLMHEIPDLKQIMQKRAKNKLKWQEFKIQEMIENQKMEGLLDTNIPDFSIPSSQKQISLIEKNKKTNRGYTTQSESIEQDQEQKRKQNVEKQDFNTGSNIHVFNDEYQLLTHSRSDLMVPHARKLQRSEDTAHQNIPNSNLGKVHEGSLRGYERIEDQLRVKEQVLELMEKNANNLNQQLHSKIQNNEKKKNAHEEAIHNHVGHLIGNQDWFDMEKKKQLEQKIADAIKLRRQPPGSKRVHLQFKQKVVTLPPVPTAQTTMNLTTNQNNNSSVTSLASLPYDMQKKVIKFKKERDRSQFNEYINSLTDIAYEELHSPMSNSSSTGQFTSLKVLRTVGRPSLSLSTNDKSLKQVFFPQSETNFQAASQNELLSPSPLPKKSGQFLTIGKTIHSSLSQLVGHPQAPKMHHAYYYQTKPNNSQSSFQNIVEEPILESQISQKNIDSNCKQHFFSNEKPELKLKSLQKQSTLQELEDDFENQGAAVVVQKSSLEAFENIEKADNNKQEQKIQLENYYVSSNSQSKIRITNANQTNQINNRSTQQHQTKINSIQYKSLNEIEQINFEESINNANKAQQLYNNKDQNIFTNNQQGQQQQQHLLLPSIKSTDNLMILSASPGSSKVQTKQFFQGGFKGNKMLKKYLGEKQKQSHILQNSATQKLLEKTPPEFIIKSHIQLKQEHLPQNKITQITNSANPNKSITGNQAQSNTNSRSQSFQIKLQSKI